MAILSISDTKGARSASWSGNSGRQYTLELVIITDGATMGPRSVLKSIGLRNGDYYRFPLISTANEWDYGAFIQSVDCKEVSDDGTVWRVTLQYGPFDWTNQGGATTEAAGDGRFDPFKVPPQVKWYSHKMERHCVKDATGQPVLNTAGDPFDPVIKRDDSRPVLSIIRNEPFFNPSWAQQYKDHVNKGMFLGWDPNTVKCSDITANRQYNADYGYFWEVSYEFEIREYVVDANGNEIMSGWFEVVPNVGLRELDESGEPVPVIMKGGSPATSPVYLTKAGIYDPMDTDSWPYYLKFQIYPAADFDKLNMPNDLLTVGSIPGSPGS